MEKIRVGLVGLGHRGLWLLKTMLVCDECEVVALCDLYEDRMEEGKKIVEEKRGNTPTLYPKYEDLINDEQVDAVVIAAYWEAHTRIAVKSMKAGKYTGVEVAGAYDIEDCWQLVRTYEETGTPIMLLENCCFDKFELLTTSLVRAGKLGRVVYCHGAYTHDLRDEILSGNVNRHYRLRNYMHRNCENYPTHELGPIAKLLNINRGNKMLSLTSVATKSSAGLEQFTYNEKSPDPALAGTRFNQGDVVVTTITCSEGQVITLRLDTAMPHYYSREFTVRGTDGCCLQETNMVHLEAEKGSLHNIGSVKAITENMNSADNYADYLPDAWRLITPEERALGHGGMDYITMKAFFRAILNGEEMPIDVYDMAAWMAITPLTEQSIDHGGMPQAIPDFTRGEYLLRESKDVLPFPKVEDKPKEEPAESTESK